MDLVLRKRRILSWAYIFSVLVSFVGLIFLHENLEVAHPSMQVLFGYIGGAALAYFNFCARNGLRPGGAWQDGLWDWFISLILALIFIAIIVIVVWLQAAGANAWLMLGIILSFYLFQIFVESWWAKLQENRLLSDINERFSNLERRLEKYIE